MWKPVMNVKACNEKKLVQNIFVHPTYSIFIAKHYKEFGDWAALFLINTPLHILSLHSFSSGYNFGISDLLSYIFKEDLDSL